MTALFRLLAGDGRTLLVVALALALAGALVACGRGSAAAFLFPLALLAGVAWLARA